MKTKGFDDEFIKEHDERHRSLSRSIKGNQKKEIKYLLIMI